MAHIQTGIDECLASIAAHKDAIKSLQIELAVMRMQNAASRTFSIAEILEAILARLPPKDVLLAQRVSKDWKAAIASKDIQEKLFFRPISSQILDHGVTDIQFWPMSVGDWKDSITQEEVSPSWNPMLEPLYDSHFRSEISTFNDRLPEASQRPEASWRNMLRSQPPSTGVLVLRYQETQEDSDPWGPHISHGRSVELGLEDITASGLLERAGRERYIMHGRSKELTKDDIWFPFLDVEGLRGVLCGTRTN